MQLDYPVYLWLEKEIKTVANVSCNNIGSFMELATVIPSKPELQEFALEVANEAVVELKAKKIRGAKVPIIN